MMRREPSMFKQTHPIIGTRDLPSAIDFYARQLGFELAFADDADEPNYVGFRRDAVELHMQFQFEQEMSRIRLRFLVEDPDKLYDEYRQAASNVLPAEFRTPRGGHASSPSGTRTATHSPSIAT